MSALEYIAWFPRTKLYPPRLSDDLLERPQLVERIYQAAITARLTIISAPAGSGKTTSAAAVIHAFPEMSRAWLKFDKDDDDPTTFLHIFVAALQQLHSNCFANAQTVLQNLQHSDSELNRAMGVLINDLLDCQPDPFLLIFDDLHLITESTIHKALDYLLEHAPRAMHILATTRHDLPLTLARLRARGELAEFYLPDLRFSETEIDILLNHHLDLNLSQSEIATLRQQTEGWVAGLRLLATSLTSISDIEERARLINRLTQSNRYIFNFLAEEVLNQQSPPLRTFLLETSILTDLNPDLCAAVTGQFNASALLETIYRRNLFLNAVAGDETVIGTTYRYHALFAEYLQHQLAAEAPDRVAELHRRAAQAMDNPTQAINHYLAAETWTEAADLIETIGRDQLERNFVQPQLIRWLQTLPDTVIDDRPWLNLLLGVYAVQSGHMQAAEPRLQQSLKTFAVNGDTKGELLALLHLNGLQGVPVSPEITKQAEDMLRTHPHLVSPVLQVYFHLSIAWSSLYRHNWPVAEEHLSTAMDITLRSDDTGAYQLIALSIGPQFFFADGGMTPIESYCRQVMSRFGEGDGPLQMGTLALLGCIYIYQGKLNEAREAAIRAQKMSRSLGSFAYLDMLINHVLLFDMLARADYETLEAHLDTLWPQLQDADTSQAMLPGFLYVQGRALWLQDRLDECRLVHDRISSVFQYYADHETDERQLILGGLIALSEQRFIEAEAQFKQAINIQKLTRHTVLSGDARLTLAHLYLTWNRSQPALAEMQTVLTDLKQRGMPGVVLQEGRTAISLLKLAIEHDVEAEFAGQVLALFDNAPPSPARPQVQATAADHEQLSPRELEVLTLVAMGLTNPEIANKLVISPGTVKRHTINIYNKLGVHNRTQAVTRARALNLL